MIKLSIEFRVVSLRVYYYYRGWVFPSFDRGAVAYLLVKTVLQNVFPLVLMKL